MCIRDSACTAFETPVTGGNVSFYNETDGRAIYPTPVIGMVGVIEDVERITPQSFQKQGDQVILLGENTDEIGGSEYLYATAKVVAGAPPQVDLEAERQLQQAVLTMIREGHVVSAHDCSEGGLACALAECALGDGESPFGVEVTLDDPLPAVSALFAESQGRIVISCRPDKGQDILAIAEDHGVPAQVIGSVTGPGDPFRMRVANGSVESDLADMAEAYFESISRIMNAPASSGV